MKKSSWGIADTINAELVTNLDKGVMDVNVKGPIRVPKKGCLSDIV